MKGVPVISNKLVESIENLADDSKSALIEYLAEHTENVRFFSYGSNMNKEKFRKDMKNAADELKLTLSEKEENRLELDKFAEKRVLEGFNRQLSNKSIKHGRAFSICCSVGSSVEGICHNIYVSVLPAFLKKEGLFSPSGKPSYKLIKVRVLGEEKKVFTLLGLKPKPLKEIGKKAQNAWDYVNKSIEGAKTFGVNHSDMIDDKKFLEKKIMKSIGHTIKSET
jgi:hypothetical protein